MLTTILAWTGISFVHLVIGTVVGKWSWRVWEDEEKNFQSFLLFPLSTIDGSLGSSLAMTPVDDFSEDAYIKTMAFMWSIKLVYNIIAMPIIGVVFGVWKFCLLLTNIAGRVAGVAAQPVVALEKMAEKLSSKRLAKKLEKAKQLKLSAIDPMLDGYTRDDIETQMEEQRRIVDAATSQAEAAKKEYKRLNKIHASTWSRG